MISRFERMMAFRYLGAKKAEGFVSVIALFAFLGILLGVATLIIVMSVMNGFRAELMTRVLGVNGHIDLLGEKGRIVDYDRLAQEAVSVTGITGAYPGIQQQALLSARGLSGGVMVRGMRAREFTNRPILSESIRAGSILDYQGNGALIGTAMATRFDLRLGESFTLLSPAGRTTPFGTMPRSRQFYVAGLFDVGMHEYNNNFVFIPLQAAQQFYDMGDSVNMIELLTSDANQVSTYAGEVRSLMPPDILTRDWQSRNSSYFNALKVERNVMFLILTLIIVVAAFNIISSMIMMVKDKGRDIAILRTMGASQGSVLRIFMLAGSCIGLAGTTFGAILGIVFATNIETIRQFLETLTNTDLFAAEIYFLTQLPSKLIWSDVIGVVGLALALSFAATIYPAWRAAKTDPVEGLRYE